MIIEAEERQRREEGREIETAVLFLSLFHAPSIRQPGRQVKWAAGEWEWREQERGREREKEGGREGGRAAILKMQQRGAGRGFTVIR